jgi:hypothetical protein
MEVSFTSRTTALPEDPANGKMTCGTQSVVGPSSSRRRQTVKLSGAPISSSVVRQGGNCLLYPCAAVLVGLPLLAGLAANSSASLPKVRTTKTPNGGIQPQAVLDAKGRLHLIYFKGEPAAGDLYYLRHDPGEEQFGKAIRVNSQRASAIAVGTIRGGQLALGKNGRVHVAWNGSGKAQPKNPLGHSPMLYARLNDAGTAFEPQRNLMQRSDWLDGGGSVAADAAGNVYVAWHGVSQDARGESNRQVWLAHSADEGRTFDPETVANPQPTGACGCCGMRAFADRGGCVYLVYRAAGEGVHRDMMLLSSKSLGRGFQSFRLDRWDTTVCPMSSEAFAEGPAGVFAAWETRGQVYFARIGSASVKAIPAPGEGHERKHPALAANAKGEVLLTWTEGTGWERGGALAWQLFDPSGRPTPIRGRLAAAVPVWSLPTVIADKDGGFTIYY